METQISFKQAYKCVQDYFCKSIGTSETQNQLIIRYQQYMNNSNVEMGESEEKITFKNLLYHLVNDIDFAIGNVFCGSGGLNVAGAGMCNPVLDYTKIPTTNAKYPSDDKFHKRDAAHTPQYIIQKVDMERLFSNIIENTLTAESFKHKGNNIVHFSCSSCSSCSCSCCSSSSIFIAYMKI